MRVCVLGPIRLADPALRGPRGGASTVMGLVVLVRWIVVTRRLSGAAH